jgi:hypothetical protein
MDYVSLAKDFVRRHAKAIVAVVAALILLREIRGIIVLSLVLGLVYYFVPEVRPFWQQAASSFVAGLAQIF